MDEVSLLEGLLKLYSPTHQESDAVKYLVDQMSALGYQAHVDEMGNAVGVMGEGDKEVMMLGHIDTVPGFIEVQRDGDILHGRGAVDAKGPLATFVAAGASAGKVAGRRLTVIGAVGEEGDSRGAHFLLKSRMKSAHTSAHMPSALIIGEPSAWDRITLGYKGSAWFDFESRRALAHTSAQNESACEGAIAFWNRLAGRVNQINEGKTKMFDQLLPTLRAMESSSDGFVESARFKFGLRLPPSITVNELEKIVSEVAGNDSAKMVEGCEAYRAEKNTPLVRAFLAAIRKSGGSPVFTMKSGTSDMNLVAPVWGCPTVAYGPGDSSLDHTPEEHILISEYQRAIKILADVLRDERLV